MEYSFRHRLHSFQQPCPCQREIDRGTERNTDRYHTEYRTQSLVYPMARLQDCRCGMGYGHRLYGSQRILCYLADGQRLPPDHIHSLFQYEKRNSGTVSGSHTSVMLRRIGYGRDTDLALRSVFRRTDQLSLIRKEFGNMVRRSSGRCCCRDQ